MREDRDTAHRLAAYSDAVFAVIVTVMVLELDAPAVVFYAGLFVAIDVAYNVFEREVLAHASAALVSEPIRRRARRRSLVVLATFAAAMLVAVVAPRLSFGLICAALILHLRPEVPA
jgi:uncharacterized membrane protein